MASRVKYSGTIGRAKASPERGRVEMPLKRLDPPYQLCLREAIEGARSRRRLEAHLRVVVQVLGGAAAGGSTVCGA